MIRLVNVYKYFNKGKKNEVRAIDNTSIELPKSGIVTLLGPSGCGKSTLLNSIGGLSKVDKGSIYIDDEKITNRSVRKIDKVRSLKIGYIFQNFNLLDDETVFNNVSLVLKINGLKDKEEIKKRVNYTLESLGIYRYKNKFAGMLSGGERQRVAIARAIVKDPEVIIADEPTGNLDSKNTIEVMNIIKSLSRDRLVILVTHERELAKFYSDRIIEVSDGVVVNDYINESNDELDYRLENKIYLKDIKNHLTFNKDNFNIECYSDKDSNISIRLVIKNDNIYIESNTNNKIEVVSDSNMELLDEHYEKINKKIYEEFSFDYSNIIDNRFKPKYSSIYNLYSGIKLGFKKILNYTNVKKLLLLGFFASSVFITYSVSNIMSSFNIEEDDIITYNKDYLLITKEGIKSTELEELTKVNNVEYVLIGDSKVSFEFRCNKYLQTFNNSASLTGSLASYNKVNNIIYGKNVTNKNEMVLDKIVIDNFLKSSSVAKDAGYISYEDFLNIKLYLNNLEEYTVVGISDTSSPSIYVMDSEFINIIYNKNNEYAYEEEVTTLFKDYSRNDITLVSGVLPTKLYEVVISEDYKYEYPINKSIDTLVNNTKLKVVGYYKSNGSNNMYVSEETIKYSLIDSNNKFIVSSSDKDNTISLLKDKYSVVDTYKDSVDSYKRSVDESNSVTVISSSIILIISLIEIYLIVRSSFLSRVKEVGILRSIGIKRIDIYKMFMGEILSITLIASLPGIILMTYVLKTLSKVLTTIIVSPITFIISLSIVLVFNLLFGLLPVFNTIRKTPHEILSRNDVD